MRRVVNLLRLQWPFSDFSRIFFSNSTLVFSCSRKTQTYCWFSSYTSLSLATVFYPTQVLVKRVLNLRGVSQLWSWKSFGSIFLPYFAPSSLNFTIFGKISIFFTRMTFWSSCAAIFFVQNVIKIFRKSHHFSERKRHRYFGWSQRIVYWFLSAHILQKYKKL